MRENRMRREGLRSILAAPVAMLAVSLVLAPPITRAAVFEVIYEVTFDFSDVVFDEPGPVNVTTSFLIDTDAAPVVILPSGTGSWTGPTLYGYDRAAISGVVVTFGTKTWDDSDLNPRIPVGGFTADVWFDAPLADGATPETWMALDNNDSPAGFVQFGGGACGTTCFLQDRASVDDIEQMANVFGSPMNVTVSLIGGGDDCPRSDVPPQVDPTATVHPTAIIRKGVVIGADVRVKENVVVQKNSVLEEGSLIKEGAHVGACVSVQTNAIVGQDVLVKKQAIIGEGAKIHPDATIGRDTLIGEFAIVRREAIVANNVVLDASVVVGQDTKVGKNSAVGRDSKLRKGSIIGKNVEIGMNVVVKAGCVVPNGEVVPDDTVVDCAASD